MSSKFFSILLIALCTMVVANAIPTRLEGWTRVLSSYNRYSNMTIIHTPTLHKRKKDDEDEDENEDDDDEKGSGKAPKGTVSGKAVYYEPEKQDGGTLYCLGENSAKKGMMIVAVNGKQFEKSMCKKKMKVEYNSKSITVMVADKCSSCESGLIDLSLHAFLKLAPKKKGEIKVKWTMLP